VGAARRRSVPRTPKDEGNDRARPRKLDAAWRRNVRRARVPRREPPDGGEFSPIAPNFSKSIFPRFEVFQSVILQKIWKKILRRFPVLSLGFVLKRPSYHRRRAAARNCSQKRRRSDRNSSDFRHLAGRRRSTACGPPILQFRKAKQRREAAHGLGGSRAPTRQLFGGPSRVPRRTTRNRLAGQTVHAQRRLAQTDRGANQSERRIQPYARSNIAICSRQIRMQPPLAARLLRRRSSLSRDASLVTDSKHACQAQRRRSLDVFVRPNTDVHREPQTLSRITPQRAANPIDVGAGLGAIQSSP